jgi:putative transposase
MNRKGSCWGNAPTETLFATISSMMARHSQFKFLDEARDTLLGQICWYGAHCQYSHLPLRTLAGFESQIRTPANAA